jgi:hypothetical protein
MVMMVVRWPGERGIVRKKHSHASNDKRTTGNKLHQIFSSLSD